VPARYLPSMAAADEKRLPAVEAIADWLRQVGFSLEERRVVDRNRRLDAAEEEQGLATEVRARYAFISREEVREGIRLLRADAAAHGEAWIDARPTTFLAARKP
jgi:hypothetical protein